MIKCINKKTKKLDRITFNNIIICIVKQENEMHTIGIEWNATQIFLSFVFWI